MVWGLNSEELDEYKKVMEPKGFRIETTLDAQEAASHCNLIVTATPAKSPVVKAEYIRKGTHITAMGSDTAEKIELESEILSMADLVVADSISQCKSRGEIFQATKKDLIEKDSITELGNIISGKADGRTSDEQITVADLTGVAVQDIQISKAVFNALEKH